MPKNPAEDKGAGQVAAAARSAGDWLEAQIEAVAAVLAAGPAACRYKVVTVEADEMRLEQAEYFETVGKAREYREELGLGAGSLYVLRSDSEGEWWEVGKDA